MKIVVIGCGTIGKTIVEHVSKEKHNLVIIDTDNDTVEELIEKYDVMGVVGNGACLDIQEEAKIQNADLVIAVSPKDEINIMACMLAKKLGAESTIARVRNPEYRRQTVLMKEELGLSMVVNPEQETSDEIMNLINIPSVLKLEKFAKSYGYYQIRAWSSIECISALKMFYKLQYCMCPAAMLGTSVLHGYENKQIVGYYYAKLL